MEKTPKKKPVTSQFFQYGYSRTLSVPAKVAHHMKLDRKDTVKWTLHKDGSATIRKSEVKP